MGLANYLKGSGYNLRERANVYSGLALGVILPTMLIRYGCGMKPASDDLKTQLVCGLFAVGMAIPLMIYTVPAGLVAGSFSANRLRSERVRKSQLENSAEIKESP